MPDQSSLAMIPQEVLEHIVFFAATDDFLGPPSGILPFLAVNRTMHDALSFNTNPHLYARIFAHKYDLAPAIRRMGADLFPATALAEELRRRSIVLKRIRHRLDSKRGTGERQIRRCSDNSQGAGEEHIDTLLWTAYLMMLESDGRNERQLREYARVNEWLKEYWFHESGASGALDIVKNADEWPENTERMSLATWLFWYMLEPGAQ